MERTRDVVVVGGGISGLTVAWLVARAGGDVALREASGRVGGSLTTLREDGWLFELGPNTVLENNPAVAPLIEGAGLGGEKLVAAPAGKRRYLWRHGRLHPLPGGPLAFLATPLFSRAAKWRIVREPFVRRPPSGREESVARFVRRRLGAEMLRTAVGPFVSGVYAGDPERLSARWAVSKIHALEVEHGSLIRGALARRKGPSPGGAMITLRDGLDALPRRLAEGVGDVRTDAPVLSLERRDALWHVRTADETLRARHVVVSVPADALASLLDAPTRGRSLVFRQMPYAAVTVVALGFARDRVAHPLDGFGFLVPRGEGLRILGCLFPSSLFPGRAPPSHVALTAFAGGRSDPAFVSLSDEEVAGVVRRDLERALGVRSEPSFFRVRRWPRAIPQYEIGHGTFVEAAREIEAACPGLHLRSNVLGGVSVADCIQNATALARERLGVPAG